MRPVPIALLVLARTAAAAPERPPPKIELVVVPAACRPFATSPPVTGTIWNQVLSLAGCILDDSVFAVRDPDEIEGMVEEMTRRIEPSLRLDVKAIELGPDDVAIRAAFQIGIAELALVTRARSSVVASLRYSPSEIHARLEPYLADAQHVARLAFAGILDAAERVPEVVADPVTRNAVRTARDLLRALPSEAWPVVVER